jgi:hypothetical protein
VAETLVGAFGTGGGVVTEFDADDDTDVPPEFVAVTVNVYDVFAVNPRTVIGEDEPVAVFPKLLVTV